MFFLLNRNIIGIYVLLAMLFFSIALTCIDIMEYRCLGNHFVNTYEVENCPAFERSLLASIDAWSSLCNFPCILLQLIMRLFSLSLLCSNNCMIITYLNMLLSCFFCCVIMSNDFMFFSSDYLDDLAKSQVKKQKCLDLNTFLWLAS